VGRKIYSITNEYLKKLADNIKFVLTNSFYKIAPELIELFNQFLGNDVVNNPSWFNIFTQFTIFHKNSDIMAMEKAFLLETEGVPKYEVNSRYNMYLDYKLLLEFLNQWILEFEKVTGSVIDSVQKKHYS
jgi:hypothetical protein